MRSCLGAQWLLSQIMTEMTRTILVADDEEGFAQMIQAILSAQDVRVLSAKHGFDAWRILREERPDVALLDLRLPLVSAVELTRAVRSNEDLKHMRLVLCTADRDTDSRRQAAEAGIDEFLDKPFTVSDVLRLFKADERRVG